MAKKAPPSIRAALNRLDTQRQKVKDVMRAAAESAPAAITPREPADDTVIVTPSQLPIRQTTPAEKYNSLLSWLYAQCNKGNISHSEMECISKARNAVMKDKPTPTPADYFLAITAITDAVTALNRETLLDVTAFSKASATRAQ